MKIIFSAGFLLILICVGFTFKEIDYQVIPLAKVTVAQRFHPTTLKSGTFLYTESRQLKEVFSDMSASDLSTFNFDKNRYLHIQYAEQSGCKESAEVIEEVRKYKHYYEVVLQPYNSGNCKTTVRPYQIASIPGDGLPVMVTGMLPY